MQLKNHIFVVHTQMLLTLLSFLFITTLTNSITTPYKPPDHLLINFGLPKNSPQPTDNRGDRWRSDQDFILATQSATSKSTAKAVEAASTPYHMARIFRATTTYSIPVTTWGPKLVRLYFPPLSVSYDIIDIKSSFLSLTINGFNILRNFSAFNAYANTNAPVNDGLVREIYISLNEGNGQKGLNLTFSPSNPDGFGFINGLEIISVPDGLYFHPSGSNMVPYLTGGFQDYLNNPFNFSDSIPMENIIRLNVGGSIVEPRDDFGLSRTWFGRDDDYMIYGLNFTRSYDDDITINYTVATPSYMAPKLVYLTMREMGPYVGKLKKNTYLTWLFEVDVGFNYLVRLHFCELDSTINNIGQRVFDVSINNQMGAHDIDVFALTGGIFTPMYRDFVTLFEGSGTNKASVETRGLLSVTLTPDPTATYDNVMLNGLEIFKLSSSNGSLANPTLPLQRREHGLTKIMIIFIILGIGIGMCMLIALILLYKKMNSLSEKSKEIETLLKQHGSLGPKRHTYADLKRITNSFKIKLGEGGYGVVYKGKLHCGDQVAVKILKRSSNRDMDMVEFINEVVSIGNTNHKNIVKLLGFCYEGSKHALIYDYMPCGSLEKFTHGGRDENNQQLSWKSLFEIAIGIARGLEYLHQGCNTRILHFDIKPQNILLDENYCPKISDFGLSKICPQKDSIISMSEARGTAGYIAPEVFFKRFGGVSHKSDVYSYGMLVLEMVGCRKNIDAKVEHSSEQYFPHWIYKQLEEVEEIDQIDTTNNNEGSVLKRKMVVVGLWCIQTNPFTRPNMTRVVEMLEGTLDLLQIPPIPSLASPLRSHEISTTLDEMSLGGLFVSSI
ncbi:probable receptor-like protein kinase At5g39030 isoform X1 [Amaranthus tricolor]|uniref:probable receptor-like protein kinase At5g39030 isoform X1 n=1 Tax=Amaranthus tricolor TaxID=29722 RepID=UPI0025909C59|nr:probable receptor-like protein kinase At5g39030 isoform X1 [Amaranthus tricolor]